MSGVSNPAASEALLSSLLSKTNKNSSSSSLTHLSSKDSLGEPVNKKPRKSEDSLSGVISPSKHSSSPKSKLDSVSGASNSSSSLFPYTAGRSPSSSGFSLLPVSAGHNNRPGSSSSSSSGSHSSSNADNNIKSSSALRLASLPGVSLTAVSGQSPPSLMPPPSTSSSSVTLSPVPKSDSSSRLSSNISNNSSGPGASQSTLLINPVTGQFEAGLAASENSSRENNGKHEHSSDSDILEDDDNQPPHPKSTKLDPTSQSSPGNSTSEPSLRFKLKVSSTPVTVNSNSSKNLINSSPKNDVGPVGVSPTDSSEPKVPKLKIRLGKDKNAVKLNHEVHGEQHQDSSNDLDDNFSLNDVKSHSASSPLQNDLKTKIKIKPLTGSPNSDSDSAHSNITSPYFPTLSNNIVNHTNMEERKRKKVKSDRLAVWTESLAKHGQRSDTEITGKDEKLKETKSWPEVLESRLYGPGQANDHSSPGHRSKYDNQDKGKKQHFIEE